MEVLGITFIVFVGLTIEIVGNSLLFAIFLYEKYGVDSMRRTTINMLWSQLCLVCIMVQTLALPFGIYGYCLNEVTGKGFKFKNLKFKFTYSISKFAN